MILPVAVVRIVRTRNWARRGFLGKLLLSPFHTISRQTKYWSPYVKKTASATNTFTNWANLERQDDFKQGLFSSIYYYGGLVFWCYNNIVVVDQGSVAQLYFSGYPYSTLKLTRVFRSQQMTDRSWSVVRCKIHDE